MLSKTNRTGIIVAVGIVLFILVLIGWLATSRTNACNVAYIPVHGYLVTYIPESESASSTNAQDQTASENVTQSIRNAVADPNIKAVVLEIDSQGGDPVAGQEMESAIKGVQKPTVALIRSEGDSAAYMAATGANTIFASEFSDVGDIGVTQSFTDQAQQDVTNGITYNQLSVGQYKDMFAPDKPLTTAERTLAMSQLQTMYQDFIQIVATNRHMSVGTVTALADGASRLGTQALQEGLIDKIGNIDDVRTYLTQKLGTNAIICGIDTD